MSLAPGPCGPASPVLSLGENGEKVAQHQKQKANLSLSVMAARNQKVVLSTLCLVRANTAARRPFPFLNAKTSGQDCASPAFWPGIPWKNEFPPECTTILWKAWARARARCGVNSMTSCCSDDGSKQMNQAIVVFFAPFRREVGVFSASNSGDSVSKLEYCVTSLMNEIKSSRHSSPLGGLL